MVTATNLRDGLAVKLQELREAVAGMSEGAAATRPAENEWCVKEVLSHLSGEEGESLTGLLRRVVDEDVPLLGIVTGLPYYAPKRQQASVRELLSGAQANYGDVGVLLGGLSEEQVNRRAKVPLFKDTPFGETPTLAQIVGAIVDFHLAGHISQIKNARSALGA